MSEQELSAKEAYFKEQSLLDLSDDERDLPDESFGTLERALAESKTMPPPKLLRQTSSFLGPTPKERQAEFDAHTNRRRAASRQEGHKLIRTSTAPEPEFTKSFPVTKSQSGLASGPVVDNGKRLKRVSSLPELAGKSLIPFYKQVGVIPRELKNGKKVKPADNIKLEPKHKQLLQGKIVYFYPNDDISMVRRTRIHKAIQLGAAWVDRWRDDVTHIMLDDDSYTYNQLLRHVNRAGFPKQVVLVKFDPYIPQCIQFGTLLDPSAQRFLVKGAPQRTQPGQGVESSQSSGPSQNSLQIKRSGRQIAAQGSQKTDSHPAEESVATTHPEVEASNSKLVDRVKDSFVMPSSEQAVDHFNDALSQAIQEAKALAHLPLDDDEDADSPTASAADDGDDSGTDEEPLTLAPKPRKKFSVVSKASALRDKNTLNLNAFQCMDPGAGGYTSQNPNARTIQILDEMCRHYDKMQDTWRTLAYRKGITTLKKQTTKITTARQAAALPFIGSRLADKIEEIVLTDRLRKLDNTRDDPLDAVLRLFLGIYGAGLVQANKWIQAGYRTLEDLQTKAKLTASHEIGIEHYDDFNCRIPRAEVEAHGDIVKRTLGKIDDRFEATVMGSYRRGARDSGDIDMILTRPGASLATLRTVVFDVLIPQLYKAGFLKASLATSRSNDPTGTKWHGASCLPLSNVWRRMDFLLVPEEEMGAALIYFTGNDIFNRSIRLLARKKNMRLNQRGLYKDVKRGRRGEKLNEGVLVEGRSEKKIFEVLGVPWREPHERIC
ncbi:uncharacterized protein K460DRAFT_389337 [Cucurbitaria berberidis CBS 394.84]|uniref:DNA-directed DNA polymerase n=1 Tax=Cucurbitaria berberidis CBS 394.84 TaxID=1168544 RepID=A0A9P4G816_9PLEO|nr:uncharacterized protein K460DRAFT_389337 [Cucurbitaria berberidis CBS 394.84]KAF1840768.1 hypothetical protein K460DRAFT_389337 [Cucurbitaria berberidis CBS 394.84]